MDIKLIRIEAVDKADILKLQKILAVKAVRRYLPFPSAPDYQTVENLVKRFFEPGNYIWKIVKTDELIGIIDLISVDKETVSLAYILQYEYWGKSIMSGIVKQVIEYTFNTLKLKVINAPVLSRNKGSEKVLLKCGFHELRRTGREYDFDGEKDLAVIYRLKRQTLYVSDLDMTLLQPDAGLTEFAIRNINNFIAKGVLFTVASARSVKSIIPLLGEIGLPLPIIEFNGSFISDLKNGKHIVTNNIDNEEVVKIGNILRKRNQNYFLSSFDGKEDRLYYRELTNPGEEWYINDRRKFKDSRLRKAIYLENHFNEDVVCFTIIDQIGHLQKLEKEINSLDLNTELHIQENVYSPGWFWLTIHSSTASKDLAISTLLKHMNLPGTEIVAFGDNTNDIKMIKAADRGIAVGNALDVLKKAADLIIGPNTSDSVIRYIAEDSGIELI